MTSPRITSLVPSRKYNPSKLFANPSAVPVLIACCRLWSQILNNFIVEQLPKVPLKDHKVVVLGLTRMLTQSDIMMQEPNVHTWCGLRLRLIVL